MGYLISTFYVDNLIKKDNRNGLITTYDLYLNGFRIGVITIQNGLNTIDLFDLEDHCKITTGIRDYFNPLGFYIYDKSLEALKHNFAEHLIDFHDNGFVSERLKGSFILDY